MIQLANWQIEYISEITVGSRVTIVSVSVVCEEHFAKPCQQQEKDNDRQGCRNK